MLRPKYPLPSCASASAGSVNAAAAITATNTCFSLLIERLLSSFFDRYGTSLRTSSRLRQSFERGTDAVGHRDACRQPLDRGERFLLAVAEPDQRMDHVGGGFARRRGARLDELALAHAKALSRERAELAAMGMADRASERIGGVGRRVAGQGEQAPHHVLHLPLSGVAVADHRLLDLERGVLRDRQAGEHRCADRRAARLPERERRLRIGVDEHYLDRDLARGVRRDDAVQPLEDRFQPGRQVAGAGFDAAARHVAQPRAARLDHSEAGDPQPGIDAEDSQSITAVVYTSCTSSRLSSASSSRRRLAASPPASELSAFGCIVISASSGLRPAFCSAAFPVATSAGAQISSTEPSSFLSTSSAPASSAASMTRSSLVPGANTNWPTWRNR